jgi:hypothetical protein
MSHGGKRDGAGRKPGSKNLLTRSLKEKIDTESLIQFLQDLALGNIKEAKISERKDAAIALLKKVLPDTKESKESVDLSFSIDSLLNESL